MIAPFFTQIAEKKNVSKMVIGFITSSYPFGAVLGSLFIGKF